MRFFVFIFFCVLFLYCFQVPKYKATAVFKQASHIKDQKEWMRSFLQARVLPNSEGNAKSIFESNTLLKEVVEFLGLQIESPPQRLCCLKDNFLLELGFKIPDRRLFYFSNVHSEVEEIVPFFLVFLEGFSFEVLNRKKEKVAFGKVGELVQYENTSFTIDRVSEKVKYNKLYPLSISPWADTVKKMVKNLEVKKSKSDEGVLHLSFLSGHAKSSADALNCLMKFYQNHIKKENEEISKIQREYLGKRQQELGLEFEQSLENHRNFLSQSLKASGFLTLKQEVDLLEKPSEEYLNRLYDLDLQINRFTSSKTDQKEKEYQKKKEENFGIEKIYATKDLRFLELDFEEKKAFRGECRPLQKLLAFLESTDLSDYKGEMSQELPLPLIQGFKDLHTLLASYRTVELEKDPLIVLEIQEKKRHLKEIVEEELEKKRKAQVFHELEGMSPETIQKLYVDYNDQLDSLRVYIEQLLDVREQVFLPHFEITSLSGFLTDSVSQEMIQKASQKALELQDKVNHSVKDIERIQTSLDVQKRFLLQHLEQVLLMQKLRKELIEEKIASLEDISIRQLSIEKKLVQEQLLALQERMKPLPEKWKREKELVMKKDLNASMLVGLTELAESKSIEQQLFHVESKPIDLAFMPYKPDKKYVFSFSLIIAIVFTSVFFIRDLFKWLSKGTILTEDVAKHIGMTVCGSVHDFYCLKDLEVIRRACSFLYGSQLINRGISATIVSGNSSQLHTRIAELLSMRGAKVLIIECSPEPVNTSPKQSGLYEYLSGVAAYPSIIQEKGFDFIKAGNYSGHFVEWLFRKEFKELIDASKHSYDLVLLSLQASPLDTALDPLKIISDFYVFHVCEEIIWEEVSKWMAPNLNSLALIFQEGI